MPNPILAALEAIAAPLLVISGDDIQFANPAAAWLTGYAPEILTTMRVNELVAPDDADALSRRAWDGHEPFRAELQIMDAHHTPLWVEWTANPWDSGGETVWMVTLVEIRSPEREAHLDEAHAMAGLAFWIWDPQTNITTWGEDIYRLWELPADATPGLETVLARIHPDDREAVQAVMHDPFWHDKDTVTLDYRVLDHLGQTRHFYSVVRVIRDSSGATERIIGIDQDVTTRKQAEITLLERERLRVALEKEQELGALKTRMMERLSHELRTPLSIILSSAEMLELYLERMTLEQRQQRVGTVKTQVKHLARILDDMMLAVRGLYRQFDFRPEKLDLEALCQEAIDSMRPLLHTGRRVELDLRCQADVFGDGQLFILILSNLLSNALKFSPEGGVVRLTVEATDEQAILRVVDEGIGIPHDEQRRVTEPFFRASNVGQIPGLGIGLTITDTAVVTHGGWMTFESAASQGSAFTVWLPNRREIRHRQSDATHGRLLMGTRPLILSA